MEPSRITDTPERGELGTVRPFTRHITPPRLVSHQSRRPTLHLHLGTSFHAHHLLALCPGLRHTNATLPAACLCLCLPTVPTAADVPTAAQVCPGGLTAPAQLLALLLWQPARIQFPRVQLRPHTKLHHLPPRNIYKKTQRTNQGREEDGRPWLCRPHRVHTALGESEQSIGGQVFYL